LVNQSHVLPPNRNEVTVLIDPLITMTLEEFSEKLLLVIDESGIKENALILCEAENIIKPLMSTEEGVSKLVGLTLKKNMIRESDSGLLRYKIKEHLGIHLSDSIVSELVEGNSDLSLSEVETSNLDETGKEFLLFLIQFEDQLLRFSDSYMKGNNCKFGASAYFDKQILTRRNKRTLNKYFKKFKNTPEIQVQYDQYWAAKSWMGKRIDADGRTSWGRDDTFTKCKISDVIQSIKGTIKILRDL